MIMISVLGVPILNRGDLLLDLVNSIDYPVEKLAIVRNGNTPDVIEAVEKIQSGINPNVKSVYVSIPFRNLGVAPSWNHIIKSFPEASFILIPGNDVKFSPGDLMKIYNFHSSDQEAFISAMGFACFGITPYIIDKVGLFDENIYPAYYEDNDYSHRLKLAGVSELQVPDIRPIHQEGSQTIRSDAFYNDANGQTFTKNMKYYSEKWGPDAPSNHDYDAMYKNPFNDLTKDCAYWRYNPLRRKNLNEDWNNMENASNKVSF